MDTSEKYIKMCQEAKEIQKLWQPKIQDTIFFKHVYPPVGFISDAFCCWGKFSDDSVILSRTGEIDKKIIIWLPHQDQLQKMVEPSGLSDHLLYCFWDFLTYDNGEYALNSYARSFYSFEQLWLAFVMHEKYGKVWNGENWVKKAK